jgi:hypothetical protein
VHVLIAGSDSTRESLEEFKCPFSRDEVVSVREEMAELMAWDDEYFARREELFREMEEIVEGVLQTGNVTPFPCYPMLM